MSHDAHAVARRAWLIIGNHRHGRRPAATRARVRVLAHQRQRDYHPGSTVGADYYHVINLWAGACMDVKARLTILIDPAKKKAFEELCSSQDVTSSQMVRQLIRQYLEKHGVEYRPIAKRTKNR